MLLTRCLKWYHLIFTILFVNKTKAIVEKYRPDENIQLNSLALWTRLCSQENHLKETNNKIADSDTGGFWARTKHLFFIIIIFPIHLYEEKESGHGCGAISLWTCYCNYSAMYSIDFFISALSICEGGGFSFPFLIHLLEDDFLLHDTRKRSSCTQVHFLFCAN